MVVPPDLPMLTTAQADDARHVVAEGKEEQDWRHPRREKQGPAAHVDFAALRPTSCLERCGDLRKTGGTMAHPCKLPHR